MAPGQPTTSGKGGGGNSRSKPSTSLPAFRVGASVKIVDPKGLLKKHEALVGTVGQVVEALEPGETSSGDMSYKVKTHDGRTLELSKAHLREVVSDEEEVGEDAMMDVEEEGKLPGGKPSRNGLSALDALAEAGSQVDRQNRREQSRGPGKLSFRRGDVGAKIKAYEGEDEDEGDEEEDEEEEDKDAVDSSAALLWLTKGQTKPRKKGMVSGHSLHDESMSAKAESVKPQRPKGRGEKPPRHPPIQEATEEEEEEEDATDTGALRADEEIRSQLSDMPSEANDVVGPIKEGITGPTKASQFGRAPPVGRLGKKKGRGRRNAKPEDHSDRMSQDGDIEGKEGDAEVEGEGEVEGRPPLLNEKERQLKREQYIEYVKRHVERYLERFKDRPNLSYWLGQIQDVAKSDDEREDEDEYRDLLEDDTCVCCNTERGRGDGFCWNVRCLASPLYIEYTPKKVTAEPPTKKKKTEEGTINMVKGEDAMQEDEPPKEVAGEGPASSTVVKMEVDDADGKKGVDGGAMKNEEGADKDKKDKTKEDEQVNGEKPEDGTKPSVKMEAFDPTIPRIFLPPVNEEGGKTGPLYGELKFRGYPPTRPSDALYYSLHAPVKLLEQSRKRRRTGEPYSCDPLMFRYQVGEDVKATSAALTASTSASGGGGATTPSSTGSRDRIAPTGAPATAAQRPVQPLQKPAPPTMAPTGGAPAPPRQQPPAKPRPPTNAPLEKPGGGGMISQPPPAMRVPPSHPGMAPSQPVMPPMMYPGGPGMGVYGYQFAGNQPRGMPKPGPPSHLLRKPEGPTLMDIDPGMARRGPGVFAGGPSYFHHPYGPPGLAPHPMYPGGPQPDFGPPRAPSMLYAPPDMGPTSRMPGQQPRKPSPPSSGGGGGSKPGDSPVLSGVPPSRSGGFGEGERYYGSASAPPPPPSPSQRTEGGSSTIDGPSSGAGSGYKPPPPPAKPADNATGPRLAAPPAPARPPASTDSAARPSAAPPAPPKPASRPPPPPQPPRFEEESGANRKPEPPAARSIMPVISRPPPPPSARPDDSRPPNTGPVS